MLCRLVEQRALVRLLLQLCFPHWPSGLRSLLVPGVQRCLRSRVRRVDSVMEFQLLLKKPVEWLLRRTATGFSVSGLEVLEAEQAFLLVGNHRDIALDPALINYALHLGGRDTMRIGVGDNLMQRTAVRALIRLCKGFPIHRAERHGRRWFEACRRLAAFVHHSIAVEGQSVWIAQRDGRAKDGVDHTDPALLKLLSLRERREDTRSFAERINALRIVPVAISYEYDPCDARKARELHTRDAQGAYHKQLGEDLDSLVKGLRGGKGRIHLAFGAPLEGDFQDAAAAARCIDREIRRLYVLHASSFFAHQLLYGSYPQGDYGFPARPFRIARERRGERRFLRRMENLPEELRSYVLAMYVNPLLLKEGREPYQPIHDN